MLCLLLVQYERTAAAVYEAEDSVDTLIDLLQIYRDKGADIFTNTCMLLGIMGFDDSRRSVSFCHLLMPQYNLAMSSFLKMQALLSWLTLIVVFYCVNCKMPCVSLMFLLQSYNMSVVLCSFHIWCLVYCSYSGSSILYPQQYLSVLHLCLSAVLINIVEKIMSLYLLQKRFFCSFLICYCRQEQIMFSESASFSTWAV